MQDAHSTLAAICIVCLNFEEFRDHSVSLETVSSDSSSMTERLPPTTRVTRRLKPISLTIIFPSVRPRMLLLTRPMPLQ